MRKGTTAWLGTLIAFLTIGLLLYGGIVRHPFVAWDDGMLITENPAVREIAPWSIARVFSSYDPELYIPLTFLTYMVDFQLGGGAAWPFHMGNIILHSLNAFLVGWWLTLLFKNRWIGMAMGLVFLVHPMHTEAVAWASARKDVLSTFFFFAALIAYHFERERGDQRFWRWSVLFFLCGLLSKVMVVTLPAVLLLVDWREGTLWRRDQLREKWPYFLLALIFGVVALGGKEQLVVATSMFTKLLMAMKSTTFYVTQFFWPFHFSLLYPYTKDVTLSNPDILLSASVVAAVIVVAIVSLRWSRSVFFALALYFGTLAPTFINFAKGGDLDIYFASDRYAYIPSVGLLALIGCAALAVAKRAPTALRNIGVGAMVIVLCGLAALSYKQEAVWASTQSLFENVIAEYPAASHVAHNNLGNAKRLAGDLDGATDDFAKALAIRPHAKILSNLGAVQRRQGDIPGAIASYQRALDIDPASPFGHFGLGIVLAQQGKFAEAEAHYREAMRLDPDYEQVPTNLGALYATQGRWQDAADAYTRAITINPFYPDACYNLAVAYEELNNNAKAMEQYVWVIRLAPKFIAARINYGILLAASGDRDGSREQFETILTIDPGNATAREALRQLGGI